MTDKSISLSKGVSDAFRTLHMFAPDYHWPLLDWESSTMRIRLDETYVMNGCTYVATSAVKENFEVYILIKTTPGGEITCESTMMSEEGILKRLFEVLYPRKRLSE